MKVFVIIATVLAFTRAAPLEDLLHPSPVNPDVLVAVKPEEKVELITDPEQIAILNAETKQPLYPTVLPKENEHHMTKSEHKTSHQKRDIPVPLVAKHHHPEESSTEKENSESQAVKDHVAKEDFQKLQTEPLILNGTASVTQQNKRETPTPLVPKHDHLEESEKSNKEKNLLARQNKVSTQIQQEPQRTVCGQEPTFNGGQQQCHESVLISKESKGYTHDQKRETSTPLVSKPESSIENKNVKSEHHPISHIDHVPHSSPSNNHEKEIYHEFLSQKANQ